MMRWIVGSSLKLRFLVVAFAAAMMFFGIPQLGNMPVDVFPEFAPPRVEIQTPCLGLSAEEVEALVSVPLEQALNGVEGLEIMRSKSVPDCSSSRGPILCWTGSWWKSGWRPWWGACPPGPPRRS
jgi:Cu/Ag efflux pump CusA